MPVTRSEQGLSGPDSIVQPSPSAERRERLAREGEELTPAAESVDGELDGEEAVRAKVEDFVEAVGKGGAPPSSEQISAWRSALVQCEKLQLCELIDELQLEVSLNTAIASSVEVLVDLLLEHEVAKRPPPPPDEAEETKALLRAILEKQVEQSNELRATRADLLAVQETNAALAAELRITKVELHKKAVAGGWAAGGAPKLDADDPFSDPDDGKSYVSHYDSDKPKADGSVSFNPHQVPPRRKGASVKPHLLVDLETTGCGETLKAKASKEAFQEFRVLKSALSYLWDAKEYLSEWARPFGTNDNSKLAVETLANSLNAIYDILNSQKVLIEIKTKLKSDNPGSYSLSPENVDLLKALELKGSTFNDAFGIEGDTPDLLFNFLGTYEKKRRAASLQHLTKTAGKAATAKPKPLRAGPNYVPKDKDKPKHGGASKN